MALPSVSKLDTSELPDILPLPVYDLNEAKSNDMIEILYSIQKDVGLSETQCLENTLLYAGDLMTVRNIRFVPGQRRALIRQGGSV